MNPVAILNMSGFAVKTDQFLWHTLSQNGHLFEFNLNTPTQYGATWFKYYSTSNFLSKHRGDGVPGTYEFASPGYYDVYKFRDYMQGQYSILDLKKYDIFQNNTFDDVEVGDIVEVPRLSPGYDEIQNISFQDFYRRARYKFKISSLNDTYFRRVSDFPDINPDINHPEYSVIEEDAEKVSSQYGSHLQQFYKKNLGDHIHSWSIPDSGDEEDILDYDYSHGEQGNPTKYEMAYVMTLICGLIQEITNNILERIAIEEIDDITEYYTHKLIDDLWNADNNYPGQANQTMVTNYNNLTEVDKAVATLLRDWGVITKFNEQVSLIPYNPIFETSVPNISALLRYKNALYNFQNSLFYITETSTFPGTLPPSLDSARRLDYLMRILPDFAIAVLPKQTRLDWIKHYNKRSDISEADQRVVVNIMHSFIGSPDSDEVLKFFLKKPDEKHTRFESIYNKLDDARLERYPMIEWFVDNETNRKYFVYAMYEIWKTSKYNFLHIPNGVTPIDGDINPNNFWSTPYGSLFYPVYDANGNRTSGGEPVLEFDVVKYVDANTSALTFSQEKTTITFEPREKIWGKKITIDQKVVIKSTTIDNEEGRKDTKEEKITKYGEYHLYQPLVLLGYEADLDLTVPSSEPVPAFLFYYASDYHKIKEFDANILFTVEVIGEITAFFASGGASSLRHIRHLKHISKVFTASSISAEEIVLFWRGLEGAAEVTSVSAGVMTSYLQFRLTVTTDLDEIELHQKMSSFFLALTLTSAGVAITSRRHCVKSAHEVHKKMQEMTAAGKAHNVPENVIEIINSVLNTSIITKSAFFDYMDDTAAMNSRLTGNNHISGLYGTFTDEVKEAFWTHFAKYSDESGDSVAFWNKLNKAENGTDAARLHIWKNAPVLFHGVRREINVLDAIAYVYRPEVKNKLIELTQINGSWVGGHFGPALLDNSRVIYGTFIPGKLPPLEKVVGNRVYKQFKTTSIMMHKSGFQSTTKKGFHTWVEGITETEYIYDIGYAYSNKVKNGPLGIQGGNSVQNYVSKFLDGTKVKIIENEPFFIDELNEVFDNHFVALNIEPTF
jgi:hypothetical protein